VVGCFVYLARGLPGLGAVENVALIRLLLGDERALWPVLALWCARPKFADVYAGLAFTVLGACALVFQP
jgi:hypothetical protein